MNARLRTVFMDPVRWSIKRVSATSYTPLPTPLAPRRPPTNLN